MAVPTKPAFQAAKPPVQTAKRKNRWYIRATGLFGEEIQMGQEKGTFGSKAASHIRWQDRKKLTEVAMLRKERRVELDTIQLESKKSFDDLAKQLA